MRLKKNIYSAFTLIELLIVMSILIIVGGMSFAAYQRMQVTIRLNEYTNTLEQDIRNIQREAMLLRKDKDEAWMYGVGIDLTGITEGGKYTAFKWCSGFKEYGDPRTTSDIPGYDSILGLARLNIEDVTTGNEETTPPPSDPCNLSYCCSEAERKCVASTPGEECSFPYNICSDTDYSEWEDSEDGEDGGEDGEDNRCKYCCSQSSCTRRVRRCPEGTSCRDINVPFSYSYCGTPYCCTSSSCFQSTEGYCPNPRMCSYSSNPGSPRIMGVTDSSACTEGQAGLRSLSGITIVGITPPKSTIQIEPSNASYILFESVTGRAFFYDNLGNLLNYDENGVLLKDAQDLVIRITPLRGGFGKKITIKYISGKITVEANRGK